MLCSSGSLCTMLSLQWEPEIIAVAVMYLAGRLCKFDIQDWTPKQSSRRWWEQFVQDVPVELLEGGAAADTETEMHTRDLSHSTCLLSCRHLPPDPGLVLSGEQAHPSADAGEGAGPRTSSSRSSSPPGAATARHPAAPATKEDVSSGREPGTPAQTLPCECSEWSPL